VQAALPGPDLGRRGERAKRCRYCSTSLGTRLPSRICARNCATAAR
jgi:hypothetical protein